jgi:MFS family permease
MTAFSLNVPWLVITSLLGGLAWSVTAATLGTYLLEQAPEAERPAALAWYNLALSAAVLLGSLSGSYMAATIGIVPMLVTAGILRALTGLALWKWH